MTNASRAWLGVGPRLALVLGLAGLGCQRFEVDREPLWLVQFVQDGADGVFLNETLVLHFSAEVDRVSVTRETVRITGPDGSVAVGEFELQRNQLRFHPVLPAAPDLTDGGFRPGTRYDVELRGFPYPDGLRGRDGEMLSRSYRTSFRTAPLERPQRVPLFEDLSLDLAEPLALQTTVLHPAEPLRLECAEPLDPTTLFAQDFQLQAFRDSRLERIDVRARIVSNERSGAVVELQPVAREAPRAPIELRPGDTYHLLLDVNRSRLTDFGGHRVAPAWSVQTPLVVEAPTDSGPVRSLRVDFLPPFRPTPEVPAGADGRAHWRGDVTVRLPRSCGTGAAGNVALDADIPAGDLHATRLVVPEDARCEIVGPGLAVLRAQGRMDIRGRLVRRSGPVSDELLPGRFVGRLLEKRAAEGGPRRLSSTELLDAARAADAPWTVLVAGGDLVVPGEIDVDGPLVLVAGGVIRATGPVRSQAASRVGSGGGPRFSPQIYSIGIDAVHLEPMLENLLADTYRFSVLSSPIRPAGSLRVRRWHTPRLHVYPGSGQARVRYIGVRRRPNSAGEFTEPVDDPSQLSGCDALRLLVDLTVAPGDYWDPPRVDFVELRWE